MLTDPFVMFLWTTALRTCGRPFTWHVTDEPMILDALARLPIWFYA